MEAAKILQTSLLDIVFENRNKSYGAYALRKNYRKQLMFAMAITIAIVAAFLFIALRSPKHIATHVPLRGTVVTIAPLPQVKPLKKKKVVVPKPPKSEAAPKIKMTQLTKIVVAPDKDVTVAPPRQDEKLTIGPITQNGKNAKGLLSAPPEVKGIGGNGKGLTNAAGDGDEESEFHTIEIEAKFPGGDEAWHKYLLSHLRENVPVDNGAPAGLYAITVSFLVSTDGSISDVKAVNPPNPDYGAAAEAVRVIERGPNWIPAMQNGRRVAIRQTQRIIFQVHQD
ncbi:hypothetical protein A9P82_11775 [Arachidicoccus ginsenosidimutans]|uniref:energy transducer TonB n=1 Tax=Arachidicoccus sp. BS20 TaxID=1850526 RepID=UPI0007F14D2A|nr:energy transducer TonB [Arachidicoccus sp. BS20]ANI89904.1 hypothetical protein A9P82_11775 [Arachidicoccus sp. BS20]